MHNIPEPHTFTFIGSMPDTTTVASVHPVVTSHLVIKVKREVDIVVSHSACCVVATKLGYACRTVNRDSRTNTQVILLWDIFSQQDCINIKE